jgi:glycosyltransferase involved in cell wall biosynthesis
LIVAFDTWALSPRFRNHGTYVYAKQLLLELQRLVELSSDTALRIFVSGDQHNDVDVVGTSSKAKLVDTLGLRLNHLWRLGGGTLAAAMTGADLIFSPTPVVPGGLVPAVTTIHDATPIRYPSLPYLKNAFTRAMLSAAARFSRRIITDSEWSKKDLVDIFDLSPDKVHVVYLGFDRSFYDSSPSDKGRLGSLLKRHDVRSPYIFHHGVVQPRKNLERLIHAYRLILAQVPSLDVQLVIAGPLGWQFKEILKTANQGGHRGTIRFIGALSDEDMAAMLKGASLCVIPSLYEGFCMPLVEAMASGVPTIASSSSCLPEVSGGGLCYFDPHSVDDMASAIRTVLDDSSLQRRLVKNGIGRAADFTWERCARETLCVLSAASQT